MKMCNVEVLAGSGEVFVSQVTADGEDTIVLSAEQANLVCKWILQAAKESAQDETERP